MTDLHQLQFAEPRWLWVAGLLPLAMLALLAYAGRARRRQLDRLIAPGLRSALTGSHSPARRLVKNVLLLLSAAGIGIALARPQWGVQQVSAQMASEDVVFVLDCSRSMLAADVAPSRLERAKLAVMEFIRHRGPGRVGLVAFAGQAFLQCPLTFDHDAFEDTLRALDEKAISVPGTDVGRALNEAFQAMEKKDRRKVVVLLSDGEDLEEGGVKVAEELARQGLVVFAVGVGTESGAEIRALNEQNQMELVRDTEGNPVRTRLQEQPLRTMAAATHGMYFPLGGMGEGLARVRLAMDETGRKFSPARQSGIDRFHIVIAIVLGLLVWESLLGTRRRNPVLTE